MCSKNYINAKEVENLKIMPQLVMNEISRVPRVGTQPLFSFGPSGVCALPVAAGINKGGHYFRY